MSVADAVFLGRPGAVGLEEDGGIVFDLEPALFEAASDATGITILGGYYDAKWLVRLLKNLPRKRRAACRIRIAVGADATVTLPRIWQEMQEVRAALIRLDYRAPEIAILGRSPVHFHTKLFRFLRTTRPSWFIGSANPGSERHELMVRVFGRHEALSKYVEAVFKTAHRVEGARPRRARPTTLRDFLLDGMLCHKPLQQQIFTFNAYRFSTEDRRHIDLRIPAAKSMSRPWGTGEEFVMNQCPELGHEKQCVDVRNCERNPAPVGVRFPPKQEAAGFGRWPMGFSRFGLS